MLSTNITCGRLAFNFAKTTSTATVLAGSLVGFRTDPSYPIFHPGPAQAFLAKVDGALEDTIGDHENWYKIAYIGPVNESYWITYNARDVSSPL